MPARDVREAALVLHLRRSRRRARDAATAEVAAVLRDLGGRPQAGGPLSEVAGVAWVAVDEAAVGEVAGRVAALGYTESAELAVPPERVDGLGAAADAVPRVRWRGRDLALVPVYREMDDALRAAAPDRRPFLLECGDGTVRRIAGYRGGRGPLEHRGLPAVDARLLVNLVAAPARGCLADPFAGAGGIVIAASDAGWRTVSLDADPALRFGLAELADVHVVGDAAALPYPTASMDAVASEPPYQPGAVDLAAVVAEIARVLRPGGRASLLVSAAQAGAARRAGQRAGLVAELDTPIDRKGTPVVCLCWQRRPDCR